MLAQHSVTETGSSDSYQGEKEQTVSVLVPLITETALAQNPRIPTFVGNPASYVQADSNRNMSLVLVGPVPGTLVGQKSSASFPN